jgi:sterol desaturase/sphingolipid hydroxylase (fatty acid hydroxylase superfamily)
MEPWFLAYKSALAADLPRLGMIASLYLVFTLFEVRIPAQRGHRLRGRIRNILFASIFLLGGLAAATTAMLFFPWRPRIHRAGGAGTSILVCMAYLLLIDLLYYWYHRAQHYFTFLWPVHELHHADAELNVTTSNRTYWLELPIQLFLISLPTYFLIGIDTMSWLVLPFVTTSWLLFTHANLRLSLGWLTPIVCGPHLHRIHHSNLSPHLNKNFAQFFPIYDVLFGTYYRPGRNEFPTTGSEGLASDAGLLYVLAKPFGTWARMPRPLPSPKSSPVPSSRKAGSTGRRPSGQR